MELVTNYGHANQWINQQPEITFFKKVYRRYTNFASELIQIPLNNPIGFGTASSAKILPMGDLLHRLMVVIDLPPLSAAFLNTKTDDFALLINSANLSDEKFRCELFELKNPIEMKQIMDLIETTAKSYDEKEDYFLRVLSTLDKFTCGLGPVASFKTKLFDIVLKNNAFVYPIYSYLTHCLEICRKNPTYVLRPESRAHAILKALVIPNKISHKEIVSIIAHRHGMTDWLVDLDQNMCLYESISLNKNLRELLNPIGSDVEALVLSAHNSCHLLKDFGPAYQHILNSYEIVINLVQSIKQSVSITVGRAYVADTCQPFRPFVDPNSKLAFVSAINNLTPCVIPHPYVQFVNQQINKLFDQIEHNVCVAFCQYDLICVPKCMDKFQNLTTFFNQLIGAIGSVNSSDLTQFIKFGADLDYNLIAKLITQINSFAGTFAGIYDHLDFFPDNCCFHKVFIQINPSDITTEEIFDHIFELIQRSNLNSTSKALVRTIYAEILDFFYESLSGTQSNSICNPIKSFIRKIFCGKFPHAEFYFKIEQIILTEFKHFYSKVFNTEIGGNIVSSQLQIVRQCTKTNNYVLPFRKMRQTNSPDKCHVLPIPWTRKQCQTPCPVLKLPNCMTNCNYKCLKQNTSLIELIDPCIRTNPSLMYELHLRQVIKLTEQIICEQNPRPDPILLLNLRSALTYVLTQIKSVEHDHSDSLMLNAYESYLNLGSECNLHVNEFVSHRNHLEKFLNKIQNKCFIDKPIVSSNILCELISQKNDFLNSYLYYVRHSDRIDNFDMDFDSEINVDFFAQTEELILDKINDTFLTMTEIYTCCLSNQLFELPNWKAILRDEIEDTTLLSLIKEISHTDLDWMCEFFEWMLACPSIRTNPKLLLNPLLDFIPKTNLKIHKTDDFISFLIDCVVDWTIALDVDLTITSEIKRICCGTQEENLAAQLTGRNLMIDLVTDTCQKAIVILSIWKKELCKFRAAIIDILYRNQKAHLAWIKKLGHYIMSEISIWANDQIIDTHVSDWFEIYHEISRLDGQNYGYDKMIGNIPVLNAYDQCTKPAYSLVIPLVFYFNKISTSALPLTAALNTVFEAEMKFRSLAELAHKECFASYVDINGCETTPRIQNAYLVGEYFYLSTEERKIFVSNLLEYIMTELQTDVATNLTDRNTEPVYQLGYEQKYVNMFTDGTKTLVAYPNPTACNYATADQIDNIATNSNLVCRSDRQLVPIVDQTGTTKLLYKNFCLRTPNGFPIDPHIHSRRFEHRYYFGNPTEFMAVVIRPLAHITPELRVNDVEPSYFHGEYQWSNFSVWPFYNLSRITAAKKIFYADLWHKLNNASDRTYGFGSVLDRVISSLDPTDELIETLHLIRSAYQYDFLIKPKYNTIKLHESILSVSSMIDSILDSNDLFDVINLAKSIAKKEFMTDFVIGSIDQNCFPIGLEMLRTLLSGIQTCPDELAHQIICRAYAIHSERTISKLVRIIDQTICLESLPFNPHRLLKLFVKKYPDVSIGDFAKQIMRKLDRSANKIFVRNIEFKNIIWQITSDTIPHVTVQTICRELNAELNRMINFLPINLINYEANLIPNERVNPLLNGVLKFNDYERNPPRSDGTFWSVLQSYWNMPHSSNSINLFCFAIDPLSNFHAGTANLTKIDDFTGIYDIHPVICNEYPAEVFTFTQSVNVMRFMSGLNGKAFLYTSANMRS